jgi:outer membrane protein TolC
MSPAQKPTTAISAPLPAAAALSFDEAIRQSLLRNTSAVVAEGEVRRAEAIARETRAGWLPTLNGYATYTRLDHDRLLSGRVIAPANQLAANLTLAVPLVVPQSWAASSRAADQIDLMRSSHADVQRQVALAVARAYLLVVSQKRVLEVSENARVTAEAHFEYSRIRHEGGLGNRVDLVRAEQELATDEGIVETTRTALVRSREALGLLIGMRTAVDAVEPSLGTPPPLPQAQTEAESRRTDVQLLRNRLHAAQHSESLNWTAYVPLLTGMAQPFYQNPPTLTYPLTGWQAQLVLTVPFYDGGLRYGQADERAALTMEARASLEGGLRQARSEVRAAFDTAMRAEAGFEAAQRAARLAAQALDLATIAYRAGATSNLEMIDAERRSRDAAIQAAVAEDSLRQARLDLLAASGRFPEIQR